MIEMNMSFVWDLIARKRVEAFSSSLSVRVRVTRSVWVWVVVVAVVEMVV